MRVAAPAETTQRVAFMSRIESLDVTPGLGAAKVIVNARTGSVVMNRTVTVEDCEEQKVVVADSDVADMKRSSCVARRPWFA